jgi:hypothetical protein
MWWPVLVKTKKKNIAINKNVLAIKKGERLVIIIG